MSRHGSMNRVYRLIWSFARNAWVVVGELAHGRGKSKLRKLIAPVLALSAGAALAGPEGGQVVGGTGAISQQGGTTNIDQSSQNLSLTWQSFNVGTNETVNFAQPSASAIAVNRIFDTNGSQILGHLNANGQVYLINPNGILFGQGAQVNVGGLVASTLDLHDETLNTDARQFGGEWGGDGNGSVINRGSINAANGGFVALLGHHVGNEGGISAANGAVALGAGSAATLTFSNDRLVSMQVDAGVLNSQADNGGLIHADGGVVVMTAGAKDELLASVVNNTGVIEARTVENRGGKIILLGGNAAGTVNVAGTLDASAPNGGNGGFIETSAAHVQVAKTAKVTTAASMGLAGTWLIDPVDFTIATSGGDISGATLTSSLGGGNVVIESAGGASGTFGDVNVNDVVSWSANTLTLSAYNDININADLNASGSARLALEYGQGAAAAGNTSNVITTGASVNLPASTTNFTTKLGSDGSVKAYTVITSLGAAGSTTTTDLQGMYGDFAGNYALGADIDATATATWNSGAGFAAIGDLGTQFTGTFDGLGHTISDLTINRPTTNFVGLIGYSNSGATIRNVGMLNVNIAGLNRVGGLIAQNNGGSISNSYSSGTVTGSYEVGGLIGLAAFDTPVTNSHSSATVSGDDNVGGLVGQIVANNGAVTNSYATGNVTATTQKAGGLIGEIDGGGTVTNSYATGDVSGPTYVGGLVGHAQYGTISNSFATGAIESGSYAGGLVGLHENGAIGGSHATGNITVSGSNAGGLVGFSNGSAAIEDSYSSGSVTGAGGYGIGGLVGTNAGTVSNSHSAVDVIGVSDVGGLVGRNQGTVTNSYAIGNVSGNNFVGGLAGSNAGTISDSYASTGTVEGTDLYTGGLVGRGDLGNLINNSYASTTVISSGTGVGGLVGYGYGVINNSYATGAVTGAGNVGGLAGISNYADIDNSYASGLVTLVGGNNVGGLVGYNNSSTITESYWDITSTGQASSDGGTGLTTAQMLSPANFSGFNFTTTPGASGNNWVMISTDSSLNNAGAVGVTRPMLASEYSTTITNAHELQLMIMDLAADYSLTQNIDATATAATNDIWASSTFIPIGKQDARFTGTLEGFGHTINGLQISLPNANVPGFGYQPDADQAGLFGYIGAAGSVQNVGLVGGSVVARDLVGTLAGQNDGTITNSYASATTQGRAFMGGLVGYNTSTGTVTGSHATGSVTASNGAVGGLIGINEGGFANNYATGAVEAGEHMVGGLVGLNRTSISNSYATGSVSVSAGNYVGGLVGRNYGDVSNSYATGAVDGQNYVGGLLGGNYGAISNTYATGSVNGASSVGGLIASNYGAVTNSFWDTQASGQVSSGGGLGLTSSQMMQLSSFSSWNTAPNTIANTGSSGAVWRIYEGLSAPLLTQYLTALTLTDASTAVTYNGTAQSVTATVPGGVIVTAKANVGTYGAFYSDQQGYDISGGGTLTINKADLTIATSDVIKTYDGTLAATGVATVTSGTLYTNAGNSNITDSVSGGTFAFTDANAGSGNRTVTTTGVTVSDGNGGDNYNVTFADNTSSTINQADLTISSSDVSKTYDGSLGAAGTAILTSGTLYTNVSNSNTPDSFSGGTFAFTNANAGDGDKTVTTTGVTVSDGNGGGNYHITYADNTSSTIDQADLTIASSDVSKTYDGGLSAVGDVVITDGTLFGSDSLSGGSFAFTDKNVGSSKTVTTNGVTVSDGNNGENYHINYADNTTSTIAPAELAVSGITADDKIYDGSTAATLSGLATVSAFGSDTVAVSGTGIGLFADADVGVDKTVTVSGFTLSGADADNYVILQPAGLSADITEMITVIPEPPIIPVPPVIPEPPIIPRPPTQVQTATGQIVASVFFPPTDSPINAQATTKILPQADASAKPLLQIVDGGMKLPDDMANDNE